MNEDSFILLVCALVVCFFAVVLAVLDSYSCAAKTRGIGPSVWGPVQGCIVKNPQNGRWVPLDNYREF